MPPETVPSSNVPSAADARFVAQCEADYARAEITAIGHSDPDRKLTVLLAVVELLHSELEANPMGGTRYYPRRQQLSDRAGTLLVQRWHLPVAEALRWYRANASGAMLVPGTAAPIALGKIGDDPPWPHCVAEVRSFWRKSEFWGARPGGSRWHRMIPLVPVDVTTGWKAADFEKAREWLLAETHIDLFSRSVLLGSCHLRLPNPVYQHFHHLKGTDQTLRFEVIPFPNRPFANISLTLWNQRPWGATSTRRVPLNPGLNIVEMPEGVEELGHAVTCAERGLLEQSEPSYFIEAVQIGMNLITEERKVEGVPRANGTVAEGYSVGVIGHTENIEVGKARAAGPISRLAADEEQQRAADRWSQLAIQWFDDSSKIGTQALRDLVGTAARKIDILDPYFSRSDLLSFALATTRYRLPVRILTSHRFCVDDNDELGVEQGEALLRTLDSVQRQDARLDIEIKVMPGDKSPVHDRFLIIDDSVWVLGASLNEFGSRGTLLLRLPPPPLHDDEGKRPVSIARDVFDVEWNRPSEGCPTLKDWAKKRAAAQAQRRAARTTRDRARESASLLKGAIRRLLGVWRA